MTLENLTPHQKEYLAELVFFYALGGAILDLKGISEQAYQDFWSHLDLHLTVALGSLQPGFEEIQEAAKVLDQRLREQDRRRQEYLASLTEEEVASGYAARNRFQTMLETGLGRISDRAEWNC